jgi:hypothetical protein
MMATEWLRGSGNINCGLLDSGSEQNVVDSARYALHREMPGRRLYFLHQQLRLHRHEAGEV